MRPLLLALPLLLLLPCTAASAGESKTFAEHGFAWTMPSSEWEFVKMDESDVRAGFVAKAECMAASIEAIVYTKATDGLSLDERVAELKAAGGEGLGVAAKTVVKASTLSGVAGKVVIQKIKADGVTGHFRKYAIVSDGKFYQLLVRCWYGANESAKDEVNGIRKGFRLLKGAGKEDMDEPLDEVGGEDPSDNDSGGNNGGGGNDGGGMGGSDSGDWPAGGPAREGNTVKIHEHNMEWTLRGDGPWRWTGAIDNVKAESGQFVVARGKVERKKKEFEKDTPDYQEGRFDLIIQPAIPGFRPDTWVKGGEGQKQVDDWKFFEEIYAAKTRTKDVVKLGNHEGAYLKLEGKSARRGEPAVLMMFVTQLQGELYLFRAFCHGHTDVYKQMAPHVGRALAGVKFLDTKEPQAGPLQSIIPAFSGKRGKDKGQEKEYTGPGFTFEKPEILARIEPGGQVASMNRDFRYGFEGRSEDGEAYLYFEIRTYKLNVSNVPNPDEEKFINKRGQDWLAGAGEDASIGGKDGKLKFKKGSFGTAKGLTYEFEGQLEEAPFIEQGWVVKHKSTLLWIKVQFGGVDAEKKLKKLWKDVRKGLKFKK